jgi:hypothetical protein
MLMTDRLPKSNRANLTDTRNVTFSQALEAGLTHYDYLDGRKTGRSGREAALVSHSVSPDKAKELKTNGTFGPLFDGLSPKNDLQQSLENRLRQAMAVNGCQEYVLTWKRWDMKSGPPICALRASGRRISGKGYSGWQSPKASDCKSPGKSRDIHLKHQAESITAGWPTASSRDWKDTPGMATEGTNPDGSKRTRMDQLPRVAQLGFWSNSIPIPCADGKWRRVPDLEIEPAIFDLLSDGVSAILGFVWPKGCANLKAEVFNYAEETKTRPGKILQALWEKALQKTIQRNAGRHGAFSETEILFIALCQLSRDQEQEIGAAAQNILEAQEKTVRILWENAPKPAISSCPSHQRKLEGSPARESSDAVRWMPSKTAHKASGNMQGLWGKGQKTQDVSETFSKMEKIWRSVANKDMRWSKKMEDCKGWSDGLTLFPLSTSFLGRVGLLRGAGNAIVPQVAAAFIKACFDD